MNSKNDKNTRKESWETLAQIGDYLDEVYQWSRNEAYNTLKKLCEKWKSLCSQTASSKSRKFCQQCEQILAECDSFRRDIVSRSQYFADISQDRLPVIIEQAGDDKKTVSLLKQIIELWNTVEQPHLVSLYEKSEQLEARIRDMIGFAMQPTEITD